MKERNTVWKNERKKESETKVGESGKKIEKKMENEKKGKMKEIKFQKERVKKEY